VSFIENVRRAKVLLQEEGRISVRGLKREFVLDDDAVEELVEELVEIQRVAVLEGRALAWVQVTDTSAPAAEAPLPAASEAERRQLTVMFVDLVDSTELSRRLDAEDLRDVMRAYQASASELIERYEGHVAQYLGDGLLVYFGWPQAHEDDAERAVRAGLAIANMLAELNPDLQAQHGVSLELRVGIHTGPVVVSEIGAGDHIEILALGDTTNIAARLQSEAEPDTVVLAGDTLRLVAGVFATRDLGERNLKGVGTVRVHRALQPTGVRSRLALAATLTPVVGRHEELGMLLARWDKVQEGEGQADGPNSLPCVSISRFWTLRSPPPGSSPSFPSTRIEPRPCQWASSRWHSG
jgi:class 3 adenylate cyclase